HLISYIFFFFPHPSPPESYPLSLHDALPILGAFIAAMGAGDMALADMEEVALSIRQEDILDFNWWGLLTRRGRARSLYRGKAVQDRKSTRLNSSHVAISYAVFCLKKKKNKEE